MKTEKGIGQPSFDRSAMPLLKNFSKTVKTNREKLDDIKIHLSYVYRPHFEGNTEGQRETLKL